MAHSFIQTGMCIHNMEVRFTIIIPKARESPRFTHIHRFINILMKRSL